MSTILNNIIKILIIMAALAFVLKPELLGHSYARMQIAAFEQVFNVKVN